MPEAIVFGGANGAGKSTFARYVLPPEMSFLNADEIAKALPDDYIGNRELESGRQLLRRMDDLAAAKHSFATETTLASRSLAPRLRELQAAGYRVILFYIWVPTPELCTQRVAQRVLGGGHHIPEATVHRRHKAGLLNLFASYIPLANEWGVYANDDTGKPRLIANQERVYDSDVWKIITHTKEEYDAQ